jgi:arginine N-succinyltransferase
MSLPPRHPQPAIAPELAHGPWTARPGLQPWAPDAQPLPGWKQQMGAPLSAASLDPTQGEQGWLWVDAKGQALAALRWRLSPSVRSPRFSFHVGCRVHASPELGLYQTHNTLQLGNDHTGQPELLELAHLPSLDVSQAGHALLALLRAAWRELPASPGGASGWMTVELPGQRDGQGRSPFWEGLGAWVFPGHPQESQARWGDRWWAELASLLPQTTLYLTVMSLSLRAAVARVGEPGRIHAQALRDAGFVSSQHVRIDDGGPILMQAMP